MQIQTTTAPKAGHGGKRPGAGRRPFVSTQCELPIPPSVNALWFNVAGRGRFRTDSYKAWLAEAGWMLKEQRVTRIRGPVGLTMLAGLPKRPRDLDGCLKAACDLLEANGIIENDRLIAELFVRWDKTVPSGLVRLEIRQVLAPALRMSAEARQRISARQRELQAWHLRQQAAMVESCAMRQQSCAGAARLPSSWSRGDRHDQRQAQTPSSPLWHRG